MLFVRNERNALVGLPKSRPQQLQRNGKLFRAYGAVPADSVRPEIPGEPEPVGSTKTERGERTICCTMS